MTQCERLIAEGIFNKDFFKEEVRNDFLVDTTRKKVWAIEIDLLFQLDRICKKYNLCYYLIGGSLLGAIRHNGFIPWDDDLDVGMPRRDYEKLLKVAPSELQYPYFFQTPETDEGYYYTFAKIRNSETAAFLPLYQYQKFNMGILLDIFPIDVYCEDDAQENFNLIQKLTCENTTHMRMTNPHLSEKDIERVKQYKGGNPKERYNLIQKTATKHESDADNSDKRVLAVFTGYALSKLVWHAADLSETIMHPFEGFEFPIPVGWERMLRTQYGDYHQFPPVEQRGTWHSDYIIDPDKSYKEYYASDVDSSSGQSKDGERNMNIAVLLAGGVGKRLGAGKPKQFVEVLGKPMILYAMELYERSPVIDALEIVCIPEYKDYVWQLAKDNGISKLRWVCDGGGSCQESTRNGIFNLEGICSPNDMISVNMSSSLFVSDEILEDSFRVAHKYGSAFACLQCVYNNAETEDGISSTKINFKEKNRTINMPWTASFAKLDAMYRKAYEQNIETGEASYMPTLFIALGEPIYFSLDDGLNKIHIQRPADIEIAEAILEYRQNHKKESDK